MKLRYIKEQKDRASSYLKHSRKREKFNLDSDESEGGDVFLGNGFTHRGKPLLNDDDFDEKIEASSDDERADKGNLNEDMVNEMNFGQGNEDAADEKKKSRKEVFEEIIEKSKAYKEANKELKTINQELITELDDGYNDLLGMLDFTRKKNNGPAESSDPKIQKADEKGKEFDKVQMSLKFDQKKATPVQAALSEHDQAALRKRKIEETLNTQANAKVRDNSDSAEEDTGRKRDAKRKDKREVAIEKALKEQERIGKDTKKSEGAGEAVAGKVKKVEFDDDLQSQDEASDDDDEEYGEEEGDEESDSDE